MKRITFLLLIIVLASASHAQEYAGWIRQSAISPDGTEIAFSYQGDIYISPVDGGEAVPLTFNKAHDFMPVWSNDGKKIAFASNRYGNFDVFVTEPGDGMPTRLSYHSNDEYPYTFSSDNSAVIFGGQRMDDVNHRQFPTSYLPEVYSVPVSGGWVSMVWTIPAEDLQYSPDGSLILYHDKKGGENTWRKHHTSSVTRDIWLYDVKNEVHRKLSTFRGEDRNPVFAGDNNSYCYLSEESGTFNVYRSELAEGSASTQLTHFTDHPVRYLSSSAKGTLCFTQHGDLYILREGGEPEKINILVRNGDKMNNNSIIPVSGTVSEMAVSPDGKEVAYIIRGEVFVSSVESKFTKRITNTAAQEKFVSFSPDGKKIIYASERDSRWGIYSSSRLIDTEPYFFASTLIEEKKLVVNEKDNYQPRLSPNGLSIAFIENKTNLVVKDLKTGEAKTLLSPDQLIYMRDGDQYFRWSPDSKWIIATYSPRLSDQEIVLLRADGSEKMINLTQSGYTDINPVWADGGKQIMWFSDRDGLRSWANSGGRQMDVYSMFLTKDAWDRFRMSDDEYKLLKETEKKKKDAEKKEDDKKKKKKKNEVNESEKDSLEVKIELDGLDIRKKRFTIHSSNLADAVLSKDSETLYYLARFEKGYNLWKTKLRTRETAMVMGLDSRSASLEWDKDKKNLFLLADGRIYTIDPEAKKKKPVAISGEISLDLDAERQQMYAHMVRRVKTMFYTSSYHGADWDKLVEEYGSKLKYISNDTEFTEFLSEILGELNVSHCGARLRYTDPLGDKTSSLGIFFDYAHKEGLKITEVIKNGPLDRAELDIKPGMLITRIDGAEVSKHDYASLLNRKEGIFTSLTVMDPSSNKTKNITVKPVSLGDERSLLYDRWVKQNEEEVARLSNGTLGYVHIPGMGDGPYRNTFERVMGKYHDCEGLIVDTRFNGGGDLVSDLAMFLTGKKYIEYAIESRPVGYEPTFRWTKPSVAMVNEANYSDGHCFACGYQNLGIGKMIGMPVPGTCSWAGWEMLQNGTVVWGSIPVSAKNSKGEWLENVETVPDFVIKNEPGKIDKGEDQQLVKAVEELTKAVEKQ